MKDYPLEYRIKEYRDQFTIEGLFLEKRFNCKFWQPEQWVKKWYILDHYGNKMGGYLSYQTFTNLEQAKYKIEQIIYNQQDFKPIYHTYP